MRLSRLLLFICFLLGSTTVVWAQDEMVTVPDLTNLNAPQAAVTLNEAGLRLGTETVSTWTIASGVPQNTIGNQSAAAGSEISAGTNVDVEVLRAPNVILIYDDNDITFVNRAGSNLLLDQLTFQAVDTPTPIGNTAVEMTNRNQLESGDCGQFWSIVDRRSSKELPECDNIYWRATRAADKHFWTQVNGVQEFVVLENRAEIMRCPAAPAGSQDSPLRCEFFTGATADSDYTGYYYLAYTTEAVALLNPTADHWMRTNQAAIFNFNPQVGAGVELRMGDANLYGNPDMVADMNRLAPQQCLVMTTGGTPPLPQACTPIAQLNLTPAVAFWLFEFEVLSSSDGLRHSCPAATEGRLTLCIVPQ